MEKSFDIETMLPDFSTSPTRKSSSVKGEKLTFKQFLVVYLKWIMFFTSSVSLLCAGFGIMGAAGWSISHLEIVAWSFLYSGSIKAWFGLRGFSITTSLNPDILFTYYSDTSCSTSIISNADGSGFCNSCLSAGKVSFGLSIMIIFCMLLVSILSIFRINQNIYVIKISILVLSFGQLIFTLAGFANWSQNCFGSLNNSPNITSSEWTGFDVTIIGFAFGLLQFILQLIIPSEADEIFTPKILTSFNDIVSRMSMVPLRRPSMVPNHNRERGQGRGHGIIEDNLKVIPIEI